jgi:hypothetical protein
MVNYTSSASLGGGSFAPSVQYNTPVRMPTQPMPNMPDVHSEFNIDLRSVGQAILGVEELKTKAALSEKEMELKNEQLKLERLQQMEIKKAEWGMKQQQHQEKMMLEYAKLQAKDKNDTRKTLELNNAIASYNKGLDVLEAEMSQNLLDYSGYETEKRRLFDQIGASLQYNNINSFSEAMEQVRPGTGIIKSAYMKDLEASAEKGREAKAEEDKVMINNLSNLKSISPEEAAREIRQTEKIYTEVSEDMKLLNNPDLSTEERERIQHEMDEKLGVIGGSKVIYEFNKHINDIHKMSNPAEGVKMLRESFHAAFEGTGIDSTKIELLWNVYKSQNNLDQLVENVSKLDTNILNSDRLFINRAFENKRLELLNNEYIGDFYTTMEAFPIFKDIYLNDPSNFTELANLVSAVVTPSTTRVNTVGDNWEVTLSNGKKYTIAKETANTLLKTTGADDLQTALITASFYVAKKYTQQGNFEAANRLNDKCTEAILQQNPENKEENQTKMKNIDTILGNYLGGKAENVVLQSSVYKLKNRFGDKGFVDLTGKIAYLVPDKVWSNKIKGGKLYVFPKSDGTLGIHREQFGVLGGVGRRSFIDKAKEISKTMADAGLSVEEQITIVRTALNDNKDMFEIKEKDWEPSALDRVKIFSQSLLGESIDIGAEIDTDVANFASMISKASSMEELEKTLNKFTAEARNDFKKSLEYIRDNNNQDGFIRESAEALLNMSYLWTDNKLSADYFSAVKSEEPSTPVYRKEKGTTVKEDDSKFFKPAEDTVAIENEPSENVDTGDYTTFTIQSIKDTADSQGEPSKDAVYLNGNPQNKQWERAVLSNNVMLYRRNGDVVVEYEDASTNSHYGYDYNKGSQVFEVDDLSYNGSIALAVSSPAKIEMVEEDGGYTLYPVNPYTGEVMTDNNYGHYPASHADKMKKAIEKFYKEVKKNGK